MRNVKVERHVERFCETLSKIIAHDITTHKAHTFLKSHLFRSTPASLDAGLNIQDSRMQSWIRTAEQRTIGSMRTSHVEQARRRGRNMDMPDDISTQRRCQRGQTGIVASKQDTRLGIARIFLVWHRHGLLIGMHDLRQMIPDGNDVLAMDDIWRNTDGRSTGEPAPRHARMVIRVFTLAQIAGGDKQLEL